MRLVLDTNILLDIALERKPYVDSADMLVALGALGEFELWIGSSQVTDFLYAVTEGGRKSLAEEARRMMKKLRRSVHVYATSEEDYDAVAASTWTDLEDAFVFQTALRVKADAIITRNQNDFRKSHIRVCDCAEFFEYMEREEGLCYSLTSL